MNASRRPAPLPLTACLLRTPRRLASCLLFPSGKSLPSSPLVPTSRLLAPLPLLLIALLALGGVLLWSTWSTPAEARATTRILVSNVSQGSDDKVETSGNDHAQLFQTAGATNGYRLTSVIVVSEDDDDDDFDVEICEADATTQFPTSTCTVLASPSSSEDFEAGGVEFTHPGGISLSANTNYVAVIKQRGSESVDLDSTTSAVEDSTGLTGWSIKDKYYWNNGGTWTENASNESIQITVKGYATPADEDPTGMPVIYPSADGAGNLAADTYGIVDPNGSTWKNVSDNEGVGPGFFDFSYQWIRVDGMTETNVGVDSHRYQPVEADIGKRIKVQVSFTDGDGYEETATTSLPFGPVARQAPSLPASTLVSNTGQTPSADATITQQYAQEFHLGAHGQGYVLSSVSIDLAAVPSNLTVSLWIGGQAGGSGKSIANKVFDFENPLSFQVGLNEFTAPAGALAYQNVTYWIVLSDFGTSLSIKETTSDAEDAGGSTGAEIGNEALVRALDATGYWRQQRDYARNEVVAAPTTRTTGVDPNTETPVLRLAVEGSISRRPGGILASNYAQIAGEQEIISAGDEGGLPITLGAADRYLFRGFSWYADGTGAFETPVYVPFDLRSGFTLGTPNPAGLLPISAAGDKLFGLIPTRYGEGINIWAAPQGATVAGSESYLVYQDYSQRRPPGTVLSRVFGPDFTDADPPTAPGVSLAAAVGDIAAIPLVAILGEPLYAMVQNLGQTDSTFVTAGGSLSSVVAQGFTTGPNAAGYELQGIGVNIEGSDNNSNIAQIPDDAASVSVAVYSVDANGKPDTKQFDLLSPTEYAPASLSFFEAPAGATLAADTSYAVVWSKLGGTSTRLQDTASSSEDAGALSGFSIADVFYRGGDVATLAANSGSNVLEIAVYTARDFSPPGKRVSGFDLDSDNSDARGIWGNDDTFWVANDGTGATDKLYAYNRSDGSRDSSNDFDNLNTAGNNNPRGICSDGTTMFVADSGDDEVYAYKMSDTTRDSGKDVTLDSANNSPQGLSCDRTHLWVAQDNNDLTSKIFVYLRSDESHASTLDIGASTLSPSSTVGAINNNDQRGMWSNGTTLYVVDHGDSQVYGYKLSDRSRDDDKNLTLDTANANAWGLWFDGRVLWVVDDADDKLYVYDLPGAQPENTPPAAPRRSPAPCPRGKR